MTKNNEQSGGQIPEHLKPRRNSRIWIFASFLLSGIILFWAFTLPFRSGVSLVTDAGPEDTLNLRDDAEITRTGYLTADEFRAAALELEEKFMKARKEKNRLPEVPGKPEVKQWWSKRIETSRTRLKQLGEPERGTLEWQEKQDLIKVLRDTPR